MIKSRKTERGAKQFLVADRGAPHPLRFYDQIAQNRVLEQALLG
jgi:hypothetical protein